MEDKTKQLQKKLINQTQNRLNKLLRSLMKTHSSISRRANTDQSDLLEDFLARSFANRMFTKGFSVGPFGFTPAAIGSLPEAQTMSSAGTLSNQTLQNEMGLTETDICNDIRGRDRACCNSASRCFDDVKNVVDELDNQPPDSFSLMSACRRVSAELKRDRICVQSALSHCGGPDRNILQTRFDSRVETLYSQFYKHCSKNNVETTTAETSTTTSTSSGVPPGIVTSTIVSSTNTNLPTSGVIPNWSGPDSFPNITPHNQSGHSHDDIGSRNSDDITVGSGAIIAGAITGGVVLLLVIFVAIILWCKRRGEKNGSNGSAESTGIFFQKRPTENVPRANNNNKSPAMRQDSTIYAEIDEALVNPGYKPPVPSSLPLEGYLNPVSDDESSTYTIPNGRTTSVPVATTRGQLSYGPILAANGAPGQSKTLFYHSTSLADPSIHNRDSAQKQLQSKTGSGNTSADSTYLTTDSSDVPHNESLDDYEEPISTHTSVRYSDMDDILPPYQMAPKVPETDKPSSPATSPATVPKKKGVKVLPSNPLSTPSSKEPPVSAEPTQPIAKPRRNKQPNSNEASPDNNSRGVAETDVKLSENGVVGKADLLSNNRDSTVSDRSTKSSHHYFVLEPGHSQMDYENSVSTSKLV